VRGRVIDQTRIGPCVHFRPTDFALPSPSVSFPGGGGGLFTRVRRDRVAFPRVFRTQRAESDNVIATRTTRFRVSRAYATATGGARAPGGSITAGKVGTFKKEKIKRMTVKTCIVSTRQTFSVRRTAILFIDGSNVWVYERVINWKGRVGQSNYSNWQFRFRPADHWPPRTPDPTTDIRIQGRGNP
jgi:hypothetical protein